MSKIGGTQSERDIKKQCRKYLVTIPNSKWVSYNPYPTGEPGTPDVIGCINEKSVLIEYKMLGKALSPLQIKRQDEWREAGAICLVIHSLAELKECIKIIQGGQR